MGRVKIYEDDEKAKEAQREQIRKSNQKYQAERREFRKNALIQQQQLVKLLNKNIIRDKQFLTKTLETVMEIIKEDEGKPKEDKSEDKSEEKSVEKPKRKYVRKTKQGSSIENEL
jgi:DNA polymerase sigma